MLEGEEGREERKEPGGEDSSRSVTFREKEKVVCVIAKFHSIHDLLSLCTSRCVRVSRNFI